MGAKGELKMRKRTIIPVYCVCEKLKLTKDKRYEILEVTNEGQKYINEYIFARKNDNGELVTIDDYSIEDIPRKIKQLFSDIKVRTIKF